MFTNRLIIDLLIGLVSFCWGAKCGYKWKEEDSKVDEEKQE